MYTLVEQWIHQILEKFYSIGIVVDLKILLILVVLHLLIQHMMIDTSSLLMEYNEIDTKKKKKKKGKEYDVKLPFLFVFFSCRESESFCSFLYPWN